MEKRLEETLDELYEIEGVEACILYRIDGVPISLRTPGFREHLLDTMFWLEKQIKHGTEFASSAMQPHAWGKLLMCL